MEGRIWSAISLDRNSWLQNFHEVVGCFELYEGCYLYVLGCKKWAVAKGTGNRSALWTWAVTKWHRMRVKCPVSREGSA